MSKTYIKPDMHIVLLKPQPILSTSEKLNDADAEERSDFTVGAREEEFFDEEF